MRLEAVLRDRVFVARTSRPDCTVDNGQIYTSRQLGRICAVLGVRLIHSAPGRPQGRGKIERFFRTLRDGLLVELDSAGELPSLAELERMLQAWIERIYHRRVHSDTEVTPLARYSGFGRACDRQELREAFMWQETRLVTTTATVSLLGNRYEVNQALRGRRVELRFDPYDLERIEVYYAGRPFGHALPHQIGSARAPAGPGAGRSAPAPERDRLLAADRAGARARVAGAPDQLPPADAAGTDERQTAPAARRRRAIRR